MATDTQTASGTGRLRDGVDGATMVTLWGVAVTAGWLVSQVVAVTEPLGSRTAVGLTAFWLVGSLVPIVGSALWMRRYSLVALLPLWTVLGVTGLVATFAVALNAVSVPAVYVYGALWFAGPAVGFLATAYYMRDWSRRLYLGAAVLNLVAAVAVVVVPAVAVGYYTVAAVIQGVPMLYHGARLRRTST